MGSLSELIALAEHQDRVKNPWIGAVEKGVGGFMAGRQMRAQADNSRLDTTLKMLEIQEKMQKMEENKQNMKMASDIAKSAGLLPLDAHENSILSKIYFGNLNPDKYTTKVNTELGRMGDGTLSKMYETSWSQKNGISIKPKAGMSDYQKASLANQKLRNEILGGKSAAKSASDTLIRSQRIEKMAIQAAQIEHADNLRAQGIDDMQQGAMGMGRVQPPKHIVDKYRAKYSEGLGNTKEKNLSDSIETNDGLFSGDDLDDLLSDDTNF